ncbi:MAG: EVE domain-containing protein [Gemmatimonadota bacterium]
MPNYWLLKTEPSSYSFDDLVRDKRATWDGVSNPVALKNLRGMAVGDEVFIYHTGDEKRIVGLAKVVKAAYPDPKASDEKLVVVDLAPVKAVAKPVTLAEVKADPRFKDFALARVPRLSVMHVAPEWWKALLAMAS